MNKGISENDMNINETEKSVTPLTEKNRIFSDDVIDWSKDEYSPRKLIEAFNLPTENVQLYPPRNKDIDVSIKGERIDSPDPLNFNLVVVGAKGALSIDRSAVVRYIKSNRIVHHNGRFYMFDGKTYTPVNEHEDIARVIYRGVDAYPSAPFVTRAMVNDIVANLQATSTIYDIEVPEGWDPDGDYDTDLIPFENGLYSVDRDILLPFTPYVFKRYRIPTMYKPGLIEHPVEKIYEGILPDKDTRRFFFEMVGFMMFSPRLAPPAIFVMYGPGQTGKSALQNTVTKAIGDNNVSNLDITQISGTFTTAELQDKLINICGETGSQRDNAYNKINGDLLKQLVNGDKVLVQRKNRDPYEMRNTAKLWFVANTMPDFGDLSSGMLRRVYVVPCRVIQSWDAQIYDKLQEREALEWLVNKAMQGYIDFLNNGRKFHVSDEMRRETKAYRSQNGIMDYFDFRYGSSETEYVRMQMEGEYVGNVYDDYRDYTTSSGGKAFSKKKFAELVRNEYRMETVKERGKQENGKPTNVMIFKRL